MVNVRWDVGPGRNNVTTRTIFSTSLTSTVSKTIKGANMDESDKNTKQGKSGPLRSYAIDYFDTPGTLYMVEITDEMGDGICCGENGNGW